MPAEHDPFGLPDAMERRALLGGAAGAAGAADAADAAGATALGRDVAWKGGILLGSLALVNGALLAALVAAGASHAALVSPGMLAFSFGLRHAVDADHLAAIDSVTRSLLERGQRPLTVGLWFSLGHSSVVFIMCALVAAGSAYARRNMAGLESAGSVIGSALGGSVLLAIGAANLRTTLALARRWRSVRAGEAEDADGGAHGHTHLVRVGGSGEVEGPGFLVRCCPSVLRGVASPLGMFPVGFLFGLSFETSSEIALLGLAAAAPGGGAADASLLLLPLLFSASMALVDTLDGMMMLWAYGWAMVDPARKLFYDLWLTGASATIALVIAAVEVLGCLQQALGLGGPFWRAVEAVNDNFEYVGYGILAFFAASAVAAAASYRCLAPPGRKGKGAAAGRAGAVLDV